MNKALQCLCLVGLSLMAKGSSFAFEKPKAEMLPPEQRMARQIRHELIMLPYYSVFDELAFQVRGTVVTLSGQVTQPTLKADAARAVSRIAGIEQVVNQIEVLPLSPMDNQIRRAVYRTLFSRNSPLFRYGMGTASSIRILVKNGNVTLAGVVNSNFDKNVANIRVNGVPGVFSVTNRLVVEKS